MDRVINFVNLIGWMYILVQTEIEVVFNMKNYVTSDISLSLNILRCMQLLQVLDIVLLLMGKAKGNFFAAFFQILGRNIVTLIILEPETNRLTYAGVVIVWSLAEVNRYLYYLFKTNSVTGFLRYNGFLILYPLGGVAETLNFNDYFSRHPELPDIYYYILRFINFGILVGVVILYRYMLSARRKYMKGKKEESDKKIEGKTE